MPKPQRTDQYIITVKHTGKFDPVLLGDMIAARAWSMDSVENAESQRMEYIDAEKDKQRQHIAESAGFSVSAYEKLTRSMALPKQTSVDILHAERARCASIKRTGWLAWFTAKRWF